MEPEERADDALRTTRPAGEIAEPGVGVTAGSLAEGAVLTTGPDATLREAARAMDERDVGSVVVLGEEGELRGILTERDLLRALAAGVDPDRETVAARMTTEVVAADADWEVYEAAAEMTDHHIRHLVITEGRDVVGVLSIRDLLLAGQRVELSDDAWVVLRDPLTFSVRERRRLQKRLLELDAGPVEDVGVDDLVVVLIGSWSLEAPTPTDPEGLEALPEDDRELLRAAVRSELPTLQRAVQPAPGWRHWRSSGA